MELPGASRIAELLQPYLTVAAITPALVSQLSSYLGLLIRWNAHLNLTAVRDPEEIVKRQMGESLLAGDLFGGAATLLDFGSGAGFPGIPLQILRPELKVTLAESQGRKASFLREALRTLRLPSEVWAGRVEQLPPARVFDVVTMRAVDDTASMLPMAVERVAPSGLLVRYTARGTQPEMAGFRIESDRPVPNSDGRLLSLRRL